MLEALNDVLIRSFRDLTLFSIFRVFSTFALFLEHVVSDALLRRKNCVDKELVISSRMQESDHLWRLLVNVVVINSVLLDIFRWVYELADVNSSRTRVLAKEVRKLFKVVSEVFRLF